MIGIAPDAEYFAVNLTHEAFPGNTVRFRPPECWFRAMAPGTPRGDLAPAQGPYQRWPFDVLGPRKSMPGAWERQSDGAILGAIGEPDTLHNVTEVRAADECIKVKTQLTNLTNVDWIETWGHYCLNTDAAPDFKDTTGERTFLFLERGLVPFTETHRYEGVGWRTLCNTYVPFGREMLAKEYLYGAPISRDRPVSPLILRTSKDGRGVLGVCYRHWYGLFADCHQDNNCIHSEPYVGDLEAGATATSTGHVYWLKGGIHNAIERSRALDRVSVPTA